MKKRIMSAALLVVSACFLFSSSVKADALTAYQLMLGEAGVRDCISATEYEGLSIIPANVDLAGAEVELIGTNRPQYILKKELEKVRDEFDYVIIDCPPSLSLLTINAMTAADSVIVPIQLKCFLDSWRPRGFIKTLQRTCEARKLP